MMFALDFDGVIADSIDECLVSAHNAYSKYQETYDPRSGLSSFLGPQIKAFRDIRPLIRRGEDYVFIMQAMAEEKPLSTQSDFDTFLEANDHRRDVYRNIFYNERAILQQNKPKEWLALNPVYPGMPNFLKEIFATRSCVIVTTKDLDSVQMILENQGIAADRSDLFQATRNYRKPDIINDLIRQRDLDPKRVSFVDDHVATVLEVAEHSKVRVCCAAWGYNTQEQLKQVVEAGLQILELNQFYNGAKAKRILL
jgi:phosphoglycolate phosphatase-like HAD superfamily hydrolase